MNPHLHLPGALLAILLTTLLFPTAALPCTCKGQAKARFYPESGQLPANARGLALHHPAWSKAFSKAAKEEVGSAPSGHLRVYDKDKLARLRAFELGPQQKRRPVKLSLEAVDNTLSPGLLLVVLQEKLKPKARYRVELRDEKGALEAKSEFTVSPTLLGFKSRYALKASAVKTGQLQRAVSKRCSEPLRAAYLDLRVETPKGFEDAFLFFVYLDGKLTTQPADLCQHTPPGRDPRLPDDQLRVYLDCQNPQRELNIQITAYSPGARAVWHSPKLKRAMRCAPDPPSSREK
jgi:hypothetical protein